MRWHTAQECKENMYYHKKNLFIKHRKMDSDKILNPLTGRYVKASGAAAKKIQSATPTKAQIKKVTASEKGFKLGKKLAMEKVKELTASSEVKKVLRAVGIKEMPEGL